jgi:hypothetical protein
MLDIGSTVFVFDLNRRKYAPGASSGSPIYAEHFTEVRIFGQDARSWLAIYQGETFKIDKRTGKVRGLSSPARLVLTREQMESEVYCHDNANRIAELVRRAPAEVLRQIDALLFAGPHVKG